MPQTFLSLKYANSGPIYYPVDLSALDSGYQTSTIRFNRMPMSIEAMPIEAMSIEASERKLELLSLTLAPVSTALAFYHAPFY